MGQTYSFSIFLVHEMMHGYIKELTLPLYLASEHLIKVGYSFSQVVNHARSTERAYVETYSGGIKRPFH